MEGRTDGRKNKRETRVPLKGHASGMSFDDLMTLFLSLTLRKRAADWMEMEIYSTDVALLH